MVVRNQVSDERSIPPEQETLELREPRTVVIEDISNGLGQDPIAQAVLGKWRDRQPHGRLTYEMMYRHPAVQAPFDFVMAFIQSASGAFVAPASDPSPKQQEMTDFLNSQLKRMVWSKFVDGFIGNGLEFGFSLAEMTVKMENYRGRPMKQLDKLKVLPQASLDNGIVPLEEIGETVNNADARYRCFDLDEDGEVIRVYQYRGFGRFGRHAELGGPGTATSGGQPIIWEGGELNHILHFKHKGGDENPFGQSLMYSAFYPWSDLYLLERIEQVFLDANSTPFLTAVRESKDGVHSPQWGEDVKELIKRAGPFRILATTNAKFGNVSASNPDFIKHIKQIKDELRQYIAQAMLVPPSVFKESDEQQQNVRETLQLFVKFRLPAILREVEEVITKQFGKRLIDSNYSGVEVDDYPQFQFRLVLDNDLRVAQEVVKLAFQHLDADRLGETMESIAPGVLRKEMFALKHSDSVDVKRPVRDSNDEPNGTLSDSKSNPPDTTGQPNTGGSSKGKTKELGKQTDTGA